MIGRIVRHELRTMARERTLWVTLAVMGGLLLYAAVNGARWADAEDRVVRGAVAVEEERFASMYEQLLRIEAGTEQPGEVFRDPTQPGTVGRSLGERRAVLPVSPLAATAVGQGDLLPSVVPVTTRTGYGLPGREEIANPLHLLTGRLDLAFVVLFLLPMLILAVSYDMLSRERESGTLALLLSQPLTLGRLLLGKVLARAALVLGVVLPLSLAALHLAGVDLLASGAPARMLAWIGVVVVYAGFWLALAAVANLVGRSSAAQAVGLAAAWLLLAIVIPSALTFGGRWLYPVPARAEMIGAEREAALLAQSSGSTLLARNYEDHPEFAPEGEADLTELMSVGYAAQEHVEELMTPVRRHFDAQFAAQQRLIRSLSVVSPVLLAQRALDDIAGTGEARHGEFQRQVEAFRLGFHDHFRPLIYQQRRFASGDVADVPTWSFREESGAAVARRVGGSVLGMLLPMLLLVGIARASLGRFSRVG